RNDCGLTVRRRCPPIGVLASFLQGPTLVEEFELRPGNKPDTHAAGFRGGRSIMKGGKVGLYHTPALVGRLREFLSPLGVDEHVVAASVSASLATLPGSYGSGR
ncbi:unnamed protein product, partial [Hapterophycus canaliculatus]